MNGAALVTLQSCQSEGAIQVREECDNDKENYTYTNAQMQ